MVETQRTLRLQKRKKKKTLYTPQNHGRNKQKYPDSNHPTPVILTHPYSSTTPETAKQETKNPVQRQCIKKKTSETVGVETGTIKLKITEAAKDQPDKPSPHRMPPQPRRTMVNQLTSHNTQNPTTPTDPSLERQT